MQSCAEHAVSMLLKQAGDHYRWDKRDTHNKILAVRMQM
jgi:hypothetical protein